MAAIPLIPLTAYRPKDSIMTIARPLHGVIDDAPPSDAIAQQIHLQAAAALMPEQEWCGGCTPEDDPVPDVEGGIPGMPQDVVRRTTEPLPLPEDWKAAWGPTPLYDIAYLACGHTVARRAA
ncbi:hypothetical protein [Paenarthrobacter sp. YJN-5]|uniref:hypothetical protein n=1 Tax=Paenarthrobacter sp. YJN-5 TaxID=2735316 RepID=UPI0018781AF8|nr:hypothetical protein [Paenarthrobacter sp. YJN-5]QOT16688.1 hypothetical protein HMI59_08830 [Paenarthrobacter sp. YJN-5]